MLEEEEKRRGGRNGRSRVLNKSLVVRVSGLRVDEMAMGNSPGINHPARTRCMHALKGSKDGGSVSGARRNGEGGRQNSWILGLELVASEKH